MPQEIESKFPVESLRIFDLIRSQKQIAGHNLTNQEKVAQYDVYFDTLNGQLFGQGKSFRLRQSCGQYAVTFKEKLTENHVRMKFEETITELQAQRLLDSDLTDVFQVKVIQTAISHLGTNRINPIFCLQNNRKKWYLGSGLANLEICFDSIQYMDIGQSRFFEENELELELKEGDPEFHWKITNLLSQQYALTPSFQSKYERGVKLLNVFG
ncbi:MAG: CYTH domain-containing protein [Candidatus Poribacteria bacterium]|nr:CYTH domain-containing protein [Candidatus Poribacteria bacterium]